MQIDFGYLGMIPDGDRRRKLHALVFTAVLSRYCFVFLTFSQTTAAVIAGCEAAWAFFGGMFTVLVPGQPQAGGGQGGPAGAAVEPGVAGVRAGPRPGRGPGQGPLPAGQGAGRKRREVRPGQLLRRGAVRGHRRTRSAARRTGAGTGRGCGCTAPPGSGPAEVFAQLEAPALLPAPEQPYRVPAWSEAKVQRDFHVRAQNAFYSVPYGLVGQQVTVRADGTLVKIYHRGQVVRTHPQQPAGGRVSDPADFPPDTDVYARRDVDKLARMAAARGEAIGIYAARILDTPLPWTQDARGLRADRPGPHLRQRPGRAGVRGGPGTRRDQRRQDQVDRGERHREAGRAGRRPRPPGQRGRGPKVTAARFARDPREFATATGVRMQVLPGGSRPRRGTPGMDGA